MCGPQWLVTEIWQAPLAPCWRRCRDAGVVMWSCNGTVRQVGVHQSCATEPSHVSAASRKPGCVRVCVMMRPCGTSQVCGGLCVCVCVCGLAAIANCDPHMCVCVALRAMCGAGRVGMGTHDVVKWGGSLATVCARLRIAVAVARSKMANAGGASCRDRGRARVQRMARDCV